MELEGKMEKAEKIGLKRIFPNFVNSFLPFGIIALVAMLVLPLPVALLDTALSTLRIEILSFLGKWLIDLPMKEETLGSNPGD